METKILVNAVEKVTDCESLTFEQIVTMAFPNVKPQYVPSCTVQYTRGHGDKPSGALIVGQSVRIKDGMNFDAVWTNGA